MGKEHVAELKVIVRVEEPGDSPAQDADEMAHKIQTILEERMRDGIEVEVEAYYDLQHLKF